ncbi:MAG TPA: type II secretion system protein GspG [Polyangiaceae bacterium]|jgi:general secretion pathway protein G
MLRRRAESRRVFFPWERKRGYLGFLGRARARLVVGALAVLIPVILVRQREERLASVRATRATIDVADRTVASYRADHAGACPRDLRELVSGGYARDVPVDAWGHALRLTCPGRRDPRGFEVMSDGPDGESGGLDRVE